MRGNKVAHKEKLPDFTGTRNKQNQREDLGWGVKAAEMRNSKPARVSGWRAGKNWYSFNEGKEPKPFDKSLQRVCLVFHPDRKEENLAYVA